MVVRSSWVAAAALQSAELCQQHVVRNTERLSSEHVLHLLFCLPLRHLARSLFSLFCLRISSPRGRSAAIYSPSSSSSSSSSSYDGYDSRSD